MSPIGSPYQFIVCCLRTGYGSATEHLRNEIQTAQCDWETIIQIATEELVLPALAERLHALGFERDLPADVAQLFRGLRHLSEERNRQILAEVAEISRLLNGVGVEPVLLKGAAYLTAGVYKDISSRFMSDIDLLVAPEMLMQSVDALKKSGYAAATVNFGHHYYPLRRANGPWVELHHSLGGSTSRSILPDDELLRRSLPSNCDGAKARLPNPDDLLTHHVVHSQIHHAHSEGIWPSLRTLYDLMMLQDRFRDALDWELIHERFKRKRQEGALAIHLLLAEHVFGSPCPIPIDLDALTRLRWYRIQTLRHFPNFRWIDPIYMFSRGVIPRFREFRNRQRIIRGMDGIEIRLSDHR